MRVVALISGGKDSCFNMMQCIASGHEIIALANLQPEQLTEIDSYMYQSVGFEAIDLIANAMDLPLYRMSTKGYAKQQGKIYQQPSIEQNNTGGEDGEEENGGDGGGDIDEVEDLFKLLEHVKDELDVEAVSVGAILSDYQRVRVENVCVRLGLVPLAYLWQRDQKELLNEMIRCEVDAVVIKVAALGLDPYKHLGRSLSSLLSHFHSMHEQYGLNICGEGGEYETLTLDCPLFRSRIVIDDFEIILHSNDAIAPVGYLKLKKLNLETKLPQLDLLRRLEGLPLKNSYDYVTDCDFNDLQETDDAKGEITNNDDDDIDIANLTIIKQKPTVAKSCDGWLWIGGIQGDDPDCYKAMDQAAWTLKSLLAENNHSIQDVCSITMFVSDMEHYSELNQAYCETFTFPNPPSRACVAVPLNFPVMISALSWVQPPTNSGEPPVERSTMHVQSRSHWAPSNIGPYSQAVRVGEIIKLAGQIGLVPGTLEMVKGGIKAQCQLALRHVGRLLKAVDSNVNLRDVVQGICYLTDVSYVDHARKLWEEKTNNAIVDYVVVKTLPKNALVEWHVWAHRYNNQFEYEETGKCVDTFSISIYRRWNYENNIAAIVCYVDQSPDDPTDFTKEMFVEAMDYAVQKLKQGHEHDSTSVYKIYIFYPQRKDNLIHPEDYYVEHMDELAKTISLVYTFVPVLYVKSVHTCLSICGVRNQ